MPSISSISRARTSSRERGFALISALVLAILYIGLMHLMLIDSSRALKEAQRFRSRVVAATLAENGAELAAVQMANVYSGISLRDDWQGKFEGSYSRTGSAFELSGVGTSAGLEPARVDVYIKGTYAEKTKKIEIDFARYSQ